MKAFQTFTTMFRRFLGLEHPDRFELVPLVRQLETVHQDFQTQEVSDEADLVVRMTAERLILQHRELQEPVPDLLYTLAGQEKPAPDLPLKERSISVGSIFAKANYAFRQKMKEAAGSDDYAWYEYDLANIYYDEAGLYLLVAHRSGKLYRSSLEISTEGEVSVGDLVEVVEEHRPVSQERSKLTVVRQKDGKYRIVMRAATAVINRDDEIDSTQLFDNMIDHAQESGVYPAIDFYHLGRYGEVFEIGQTDFVARSGVVYIASGLLDETNPLAQALIRSMEAGERTWGCSIEYYPLQASKERVGVGENTFVEVYRDGINTRIAILPEEDAAAWFTSVVKERTMNMSKDQLRERLAKVFTDSAELEAFLNSVSEVNEEVVRNGLVFRNQQNQEEKSETQPEAEKQPAPENTQPLELELDDTLVDLIVDRVQAKLGGPAQTDALTKLTTAVENLVAQVNGMVETQEKTVQRLGKLEKTTTLLEGDYKDDLPTQLENRQMVRVTYRAKENSQGAEESQTTTFADRAAETLSRIPSPFSKAQ